MAYHDRHKVGDLMSRVTNDSEAINQVLSNGLITFITNILSLGGIMVAMFLLNWQLAIGTLILLPLMVYITTLVTRRSRVAFREVQRNLGVMNAVMEENIAGIRVVKAFARAEDTYRPIRSRQRRKPPVRRQSGYHYGCAGTDVHHHEHDHDRSDRLC